jgi:hypothetical protein
MFRRTLRATFLAGIMPVALCLVLGCGGNKTFRVSGTVTFKGKPVPAGKIYFIPDGSKGNSGPTGYADIKDGSYDTSRSGGQGAVSGPVIIAVEGTDPSSRPDKPDPSGEVTAKLLFARYEMTVDLPKASSTKDITVPEEAGKGPAPPKGGPIIVP